MLVCIHGNAVEFCKERGLTPVEVWTGELSEYRGKHSVLVTNSDISKNEYYYLKGELLTRGIVLISTRYEDDQEISEYLEYFAARSKGDGRGRQPFGWRVIDGLIVPNAHEMAVAHRILKLYDEGLTLRAIGEDKEVCHVDGRKLSVGTIHRIIKNRRKYEDE